MSDQSAGVVSELMIYNGTESSLTVSVRLVNLTSERVLIDNTFVLEASSRREYENPLGEGGTFKVEIQADGLSEDYEWDESSAEPDSDGVSVNIGEEQIEINQVTN